MTRYRYLTTVSTTVLMACALGAGAVHAQEKEIEEVAVVATPIRDSQAAAMEQKRAADNVVDIISADAIGRFPDQNLADSLGRLPGLAIERDQGQARYINFRGAPFRWTAIAFDGMGVLGAEDGRTPRFDAFPSVITSTVEANKAITPDLPGEAVSGYINVTTFSPFDEEGFSASVEAGYGFQDLGNGPVKKLNGRLSWSDDTFGIVLFGSHNSRDQVTDNREMDYEIDPATGGLMPKELDFRSYYVDRQDNAYGGQIELRPESGGRFFASSLYSEFIDDEQRNQYIFFLEDAANGQVDFATGQPFDGGTLTPDTGALVGVPIRRMLEYGRYKNSTFTNTVGADFDAGGWYTQVRVNYAETESITALPLVMSLQGAGGVVSVQVPSVTYDVTDPYAPILNLFGTTIGAGGPMALGTAYDLAGAAYLADLSVLYNIRTETEAWTVKADTEKMFDLFGGEATFKTGFQAQFREAVGVSANTTGGLGGINPTDYVTDQPWETGFNNSIGGTVYDNIGLREDWEAATGGIVFPTDPAGDTNIDEKIYAAYAMLTHQFDRGNFVWGARVEYTDFSTTGSLLLPDASTVPVDFSDDYIRVLPSAHFNYDVTDDLKFRASVSTGLSRPTYSELRASAMVNVTNREITGGNPYLKAEKSWGGDMALEWYFAPASILSAGVFYRSVDGVIFETSATVDGSLYAPTLAAPGEVWTLNSYANGTDGELMGLELNAIAMFDTLPAPFDGFGISANLTVLDSEFTAPDGRVLPLPGTSDMIWNASVFYEKFGLSARLNYQWRDDWLTVVEGTAAEYWAAQTRVDFSVRYQLPVDLPGVDITLFANANNLTDETDVRYVGDERTPNQVESYGPYFLFGLRADF